MVLERSRLRLRRVFLEGAQALEISAPGALAEQWAQVAVDLGSFAGTDDLFLEFFAQDDSPGNAGQFVVEISGDATTWISLLSVDLPSSYTRRLLDVDASGVLVDGSVYFRFRTLAANGPHVSIDAFRIVSGDLLGPAVSMLQPEEAASSAVDLSSFVVSFNKAIIPETLDNSDIVVVDPQGHSVAVSSVLPEAGSTNRQFEVTMPAQTLRGRYRVWVGPDVMDAGGLSMDQDQNGVLGEASDGFTGKIEYQSTIQSPPSVGLVRHVEDFESWTSVPSYWNFGTAGAGIVGVVATDAPAQGGFHLRLIPDDVVNSDSWATWVVDLRAPVVATNLFLTFQARDDAPSSNGQFVLEASDNGEAWSALLSTDLPEVYTPFQIDIGQGLSMAGIALDADVHFRFRLRASTEPTMYIDDLRVVNGDFRGSRVVSFEPSNPVAVQFSEVQLLFDQVVFGLPLTEIQLIDPQGGTNFPLSANSGNGMDWTLAFAPQEGEGVYRLLVGPNILDASGNPMNQDGDAIGGEAVDDRFDRFIEVVAGQQLPFVDDFSQGLRSGIWETFSTTPGGRIEVVGNELRMDSTNNQFALNEAILFLDLTGASVVTLSFDYRSAGDELHTAGLSVGDVVSSQHSNADMVSVSTDGGTSWLVLLLLDAPGHAQISLDAALAAAGLAYGPDTRIRFSQYDDEIWGSDGLGFSDISLAGFGGVEVLFDAVAGATIRFATAAGISYRVEWRDDLEEASWAELTTLNGNGQIQEVSDSPSSSQARRYYRVTQFTP